MNCHELNQIFFLQTTGKPTKMYANRRIYFTLSQKLTNFSADYILYIVKSVQGGIINQEQTMISSSAN